MTPFTVYIYPIMHTHFIRTISWNNFSKAKFLILHSLEFKYSHEILKD